MSTTTAPLADRLNDFRRSSPEHKKLLAALKKTELRGPEIMGSRTGLGSSTTFVPPADTSILELAREAACPLDELRELVHMLPRRDRAAATVANKELRKLADRLAKLEAERSKLRERFADASTERQRDAIDEKLHAIEIEIRPYRHDSPATKLRAAEQYVELCKERGIL